MARDRRLGARVPVELLVHEYVGDRLHRAQVVNLSETGLYANKVVQPIQRFSRVVALEFSLPGTTDTIWAKGEVRYDTIDEYFHGQGIRFTGMAKTSARILRDYCEAQRSERSFTRPRSVGRSTP